MYLCYGVGAHEYLQWPGNFAREDEAGAVTQPDVPGEVQNYSSSTPEMCLLDQMCYLMINLYGLDIFFTIISY